jgi:peroxiredoxin
MTASRILATAFAVALLATTARAVTPGQPAPGFTGTDQDGKPVDLSAYKGKIVVLEWTNPDCPFVQRHYKAKTMTTLAGEWKPKDVVWIAVDSTNYATNESDRAWREENDISYPIVGDRSGEIGTSYGARTTPHMFVIDKQGTVVYEGAIDDDPSGDNTGKATNYVEAALEDVTAGKPVRTAETKSYGCGVKYKR